ncbi:N-formylglutamate amidohydrolase [Roseixanthobacter glucoisosaccharinicivorans]|uniref:N-formylglutamate amidohydrolase n=1 Tax=Roseixanthobacter glucoisosaccharinicivorans TaxID=3119923 RepID=UPI00372BCD16
MAHTLLAADEPTPVSTYNAQAPSRFLLVADHAGNRMPRALGQLGIADADCLRHIAIDIGIAGVCRHLSQALDATLIQQDYSRLVMDCNRQPGTPTSIPVLSESTAIPGNIDLDAQDAARREREIFRPYHDRIAAELDARQAAGRPAVLIAMHSFTPVYLGMARPWHAGVLYNRDPRLARAVFAALEREGDLVVGDNEPYSVSDDSDYTIPVHGERRGLLHLAVEIRQDLIGDAAGQAAWGARMARVLVSALAALGEPAPAVAAS